MRVKLLQPIHGFASNTYLISSGDEYTVVDPSVPYDEGMISGKLKYVLLTHAHFDHMLEIDSWVKAGAKVIVSIEEQGALADADINCYRLFCGQNRGYYGVSSGMRDGDKLTLGSDEILIIGCPGHTRMGLSYYSDGVLFAGDTLFAGGGFGRWDLPGGDYRTLRNTISRLTELSDDTVIHCGHGEPTTMKEYKEHYKNQRCI